MIRWLVSIKGVGPVDQNFSLEMKVRLRFWFQCQGPSLNCHIEIKGEIVENQQQKGGGWKPELPKHQDDDFEEKECFNKRNRCWIYQEFSWKACVTLLHKYRYFALNFFFSNAQKVVLDWPLLGAGGQTGDNQSPAGNKRDSVSAHGNCSISIISTTSAG